jgi:hypothetical protein
VTDANTIAAFRNRAVLLSALLTGLLIWLTREHVFFWDTIQLASKQADWFYQNDFRYLLLPERIDSGHPPGFGIYLALWWKVLGRTLFVSHLAMAPWLFLFFYQLLTLSRELISTYRGYGLALFALANAVWWGQAVLVSPDVALAALFVTGLRATLRWRPWLLALIVAGLAVLSMRAMFVGVAFFLWRSYDLWCRQERSGAAYLRALLPFLPGGLIGLAFLSYHYLATGWVGYHADSPWAPAFTRVGFSTLLRNGVIFGWRIADYGHLFCWLALAYVGWSVPESRRDSLAQQLLALLVILLLLLGLPVVLHQGLLNHRYFLPIYLTLDVLTAYLLLRFASARGYWLVGIGLLSGNLWLYPQSIAQGWDATPAHLPYYQLRQELLDTIEARGIAPDSVGTAFPERGPFDDRDLSGRQAGFHPYELGRDRYILHADVMNDLDGDLPELRRRYRKIAETQHWWLSGALYELRE